MKNKLTTALISSLFGLGLSSVSVAQTTISGNLDLAYNAVSSNAVGGSYRAIGRETQINIANKGKLSNGMDYAAGFSWEIDGGEALGNSTAGANNDSSNATNENVYIDFFYNKDSYVSISNDHVPNTDVTITNLVGWGYLGGQGTGNQTSLYPTSLNTSVFLYSNICFSILVDPDKITNIFLSSLLFKKFSISSVFLIVFNLYGIIIK
jgi:hypothetical protein